MEKEAGGEISKGTHSVLQFLQAALTLDIVSSPLPFYTRREAAQTSVLGVQILYHLCVHAFTKQGSMQQC